MDSTLSAKFTWPGWEPQFDFYPWNSVWRVSGGLMLANGNQFSAISRVAWGAEGFHG